MRFDLRKVLVLLLSVVVFAVPCNAQETLGAITGTVTDPSGAVIGGATVTVRNLEIGRAHV